MGAWVDDVTIAPSSGAMGNDAFASKQDSFFDVDDFSVGGSNDWQQWAMWGAATVGGYWLFIQIKNRKKKRRKKR